MVFPRFTQVLGRNHPWDSAVFKPEGSPGICPETAGRRRGTRRSSPPPSDPGGFQRLPSEGDGMVLGSSHRKKKTSKIDKGVGISMFLFFGQSNDVFKRKRSITQGV